jgi:hypothetical protein
MPAGVGYERALESLPRPSRCRPCRTAPSHCSFQTADGRSLQGNRLVSTAYVRDNNAHFCKSSDLGYGHADEGPHYRSKPGFMGPGRRWPLHCQCARAPVFLANASQVLATIATEIGLTLSNEDRQPRDLPQAETSAVGTGQLAETPIRGTDRLSILATSREPLGAEGEPASPTPPLGAISPCPGYCWTPYPGRDPAPWRHLRPH